jgi:hypothetical protein
MRDERVCTASGVEVEVDGAPELINGSEARDQS